MKQWCWCKSYYASISPSHILHKLSRASNRCYFGSFSVRGYIFGVSTNSITIVIINIQGKEVCRVHVYHRPLANQASNHEKDKTFMELEDWWKGTCSVVKSRRMFRCWWSTSCLFPIYKTWSITYCRLEVFVSRQIFYWHLPKYDSFTKYCHSPAKTDLCVH